MYPVFMIHVLSVISMKFIFSGLHIDHVQSLAPLVAQSMPQDRHLQSVLWKNGGSTAYSGKFLGTCLKKCSQAAILGKTRVDVDFLPGLGKAMSSESDSDTQNASMVPRNPGTFFLDGCGPWLPPWKPGSTVTNQHTNLSLKAINPRSPLCKHGPTELIETCYSQDQ